jgi:endogenous inhibitor of DNA gyrase (YacG/DUF329 family)
MTLNVVDERARGDARPELVCACCRTRGVDPAWRPFCSQRCQLDDLARWVDGRYRVPGEPALPPGDPRDPAE